MIAHVELRRMGEPLALDLILRVLDDVAISLGGDRFEIVYGEISGPLRDGLDQFAKAHSVDLPGIEMSATIGSRFYDKFFALDRLDFEIAFDDPVELQRVELTLKAGFGPLGYLTRDDARP